MTNPLITLIVVISAFIMHNIIALIIVTTYVAYVAISAYNVVVNYAQSPLKPSHKLSMGIELVVLTAALLNHKLPILAVVYVLAMIIHFATIPSKWEY